MHDETDPNKPAEVRLAPETIQYLQQLMAESVKTGIKEALNKETAKMFWEAGAEMLQEQATHRAGRFVLGGLGKLARQALGIALIAGAFYMVGGWSALVTFFKAVKAVLST